MKKLLLLINCFVVINLFSQNSQIIFPCNLKNSDTIFTETGSSFYSYYGSNSINNNFANAILKSKLIDEDLKNSNQLKKNNLLLTDLSANCYFVHMPDSMLGLTGLGYRIGVTHKQFRSVSFSNDLYNLIFFGDDKFAGKSAVFNNTLFRSIDYQKFEIGLINKYSEQNNIINIYFGLNILKAQQLQTLNVNNGQFYTSPDGDSLNLATKFSFFSSNQSNKNFTNYNGLGLSCDAFFSITNLNSNITVTLSSEDLGYINWRNKSYYAGVDTSISFNGVEIQNIMNVSQENLNGLSKDSLMNILYDKNDTGSFSLSIPEKVSLEIKKDFKGRLNSIILGTNYIFDIGEKIPQIYCVQVFKISDALNIGTIENYGGASGFNAGLLINYQLNNNLYVNISSANLSGFIMSKEAFARSVFFSLSYKFVK